jgi:putative thiamine transport system permease protein
MGEALHEVARRGRLLRALPVLTVAAFMLPIGAGFAGTLLPAFGWLPALGGATLSLEPWRALVDHPGFATSLRLTLATGVAATVVSVAIAFGACAWAHGRPWFGRVSAALSPILATPHSALAIGLAFVLAPSGWIARAISPWLTGWEVPPDVATVGDPWGIALVVALVVKEVPYLVLMIVGALGQVPARAQLAAARALGYARGAAWLKVVLPQVYRQVRLPIFAVLAFSLSVVDVALIVGPANPPPLAVLAVRWFADPDVRAWFPAAAAATLLLLVVIAAIVAWRAAEAVVARVGRAWIARGRRDGAATIAAAAGALSFAATFVLACAALAAVALWSAARQWRFPAALPDAFTAANWAQRLRGLAEPMANTLAVGLLATLLALCLVMGCLENESRRARPAGATALWLLYLPLLVPQVAFLFGIQVLLVRAGADGTLAAVVWAHLVFVLPYLFLSLADPWRALDPRYARTAAALNASPARIFWRIKLPLLVRPVAIACAIGFAVSVGQYLPTVFAGNGRIATLTTEAVTLAAGADRRVTGTFALAQALLPLCAYALAALLPRALRARHRRVQP